MALHSAARTTWPAVALSAASAYVRLTALTVAALFAVFGAVPLVADLTGSTPLTALTGAVLCLAGAELLVPGFASRDTFPAGVVRLVAAVPIAVALLGLAVVIVPDPALVASAVDSLRVLATMAGVFMAVLVVGGLVRRDPFIVPAFRADR